MRAQSCLLGVHILTDILSHSAFVESRLIQICYESGHILAEQREIS